MSTLFFGAGAGGRPAWLRIAGCRPAERDATDRWRAEGRDATREPTRGFAPRRFVERAAPDRAALLRPAPDRLVLLRPAPDRLVLLRPARDRVCAALAERDVAERGDAERERVDADADEAERDAAGRERERADERTRFEERERADDERVEAAAERLRVAPRPAARALRGLPAARPRADLADWADFAARRAAMTVSSEVGRATGVRA